MVTQVSFVSSLVGFIIRIFDPISYLVLHLGNVCTLLSLKLSSLGLVFLGLAQSLIDVVLESVHVLLIKAVLGLFAARLDFH